jgi:hypothetical protein
MGESIISSRSQPTSQPTQVSVLSERAKLVNRLAIVAIVAIAAIALAGGLGVAIVAGAIPFTPWVALPVFVLVLVGVVGLVYAHVLEAQSKKLSYGLKAIQMLYDRFDEQVDVLKLQNNIANLDRLLTGLRKLQTLEAREKAELALQAREEAKEEAEQALNNAKLELELFEGVKRNISMILANHQTSTLDEINELLRQTAERFRQIKNRNQELVEAIPDIQAYLLAAQQAVTQQGEAQQVEAQQVSVKPITRLVQNLPWEIDSSDLPDEDP